MIKMLTIKSAHFTVMFVRRRTMIGCIYGNLVNQHFWKKIEFVQSRGSSNQS